MAPPPPMQSNVVTPQNNHAGLLKQIETGKKSMKLQYIQLFNPLWFKVFRCVKLNLKKIEELQMEAEQVT